MVRLRPHRRAPLLLLLGTSLVFAPARAGARSEARTLGSDAQLAEARRQFELGVGYYEKADYGNALVAFQAAYDTAQAATILYNIGLTYKSLRRYPEAIAALERYLGNAARDGQLKIERKRQVGQLIDEMKAQLAPVTFTITPPGAELRLDGQVVQLPRHGTLPLVIGPHEVLISAEGHQAQQRDFTVTANAVVLTFQLVPKTLTGKLRVTSNQPGTSVAIDGKAQGVAPLELELAAGSHQMSARSAGFEPFRTEVGIDPGQNRNLDLTLFPERPPPTPVYGQWWFWTGVGAALAGGTAAVFLLRPGQQAPVSGTLGPSIAVGAR